MDTGAWYAIQVPDDAHHEEALSTWRRLLERGVPIVTTNLVLGETYTVLRRKEGFAAAWRFIEWLAGAHRLVREHIAPEVETQAYAILRQYRDHDFSYVDATSFAFMRTHGMSDAFAFDVHFRVAGFTRIPLDGPLT